MTNWPGLTDLTALPTSSTYPQYSCPIGVGSVTWLIPRYGHRSDPQMHVAGNRRTASVGLRIFGVPRSSNRTSRGPCRTAPFMTVLRSQAGPPFQALRMARSLDVDPRGRAVNVAQVVRREPQVRRSDIFPQPVELRRPGD